MGPEREVGQTGAVKCGSGENQGRPELLNVGPAGSRADRSC